MQALSWGTEENMLSYKSNAWNYLILYLVPLDGMGKVGFKWGWIGTCGVKNKNLRRRGRFFRLVHLRTPFILSLKRGPLGTKINCTNPRIDGYMSFIYLCLFLMYILLLHRAVEMILDHSNIIATLVTNIWHK